MPAEEKRSAEQIGTLGSCLIEGDAEQKSRERKTKRRALTISIALQVATVTALVVTPLLAKPEGLPFNWYTPIPQYYRSTPERVESLRPAGPIRRECIVCFNENLSAHPAVHTSARQSEGTTGEVNLGPGGPPQEGLNIFDTRNQPPPPTDPDQNKKRRITVGGSVQQAMLQHKIDPCYPPLARQLRRSGQVRIHALISTDGAVESLQVLDGDPLFIQCSIDAVSQWRYKPTSLNGVPVEVETVITVVYTLNP